MIFSRALAFLRQGLLYTVCVLPFLWAAEPLAPLRSAFQTDQLITVVLGLCLGAVFLDPGQASRPGALSVIAAAASLLLGSLAGMRFEDYALRLFFGGADLLVISGGLVFLTLAACKKVAGWPMTTLVAAFLVFGAIARYLPSPITAPPVSLDIYAVYLVFGGDALIGQALQIIVVTVVVFVVFGSMFELMGGAAHFAEIAQRVSGRGPGAPVKTAVLSSALLGSVSGSAVANVVTSGSFSIPMMRRIGLQPHQAAAIEAVASTGGQIMPPVMGIAAFLMADIAGVAYRDVALAAIFPAFFFFLSVFVQADGLSRALRLPRGPETQPAWRSLAGRIALVLLPLGMVAGTVIMVPYAPQYAAVLGSAVCVLLTVARARALFPLLKRIHAAILSAGALSSRIVVTGGAIGLLLGVINSTGLGVAAALAVTQAGESGLLAALLAAAAACFLLGLGLATTAVYVVVGTIVAPSLIEFGLAPVQAHLFVFYAAMMSMITPPIAVACLAAAGLADAPFLRTCRSAMQFGWTLFLLPFLLAAHPEVVLMGDAWSIASVLAACTVGVSLISVSIYLPAIMPSVRAAPFLAFAVGTALLLPGYGPAERASATLAVIMLLLWARSRVARRSAAATS